MTIALSDFAKLANVEQNKKPNIVLRIDGVETLYGAVIIRKIARYGDEIFYGDDGLVYGGGIPYENQEDLISLQKGTTTSITQNVQIDKGTGNSIQSMQIALVDANEQITRLITPDEIIPDILGARCTVYFGYAPTNWPDDYIVLFKGNVDEVSSTSGLVTLNIIHPDNFKRANLFTKAESDLSAAITNSDSVIPLNDASNFLVPVVGPDGLIDETIQYFAIIDGLEAIRYTGISGDSLTGATRSQLGTPGFAHDTEASVESFVRLTGNAINDIALKLMLSGWDGPYASDVPVFAFNTTGTSTITNAIFFEGYNLQELYNPVVGDYLTIASAINGGNNITLSKILEVGTTDSEELSYVVVDDTLINENMTSAVCSFRSQYDTWGAGRGMKMRNDDVDIQRHLRTYDTFLPNFSYDFYIKEGMDDGKEFLDKQVYNPAGVYALVRSARASIGEQSPPLPTDVVKILNDTNIKNAKDIRIKRSTSKNFYNGVVYKFEEKVLEEKLLRVEAVLSGDSISRFGEKIPSKYLVIESNGMREDLNARTLANSTANRRLQSYQFGAESINGLRVNLESGLTIEAGDVVLIDLSALKVSDIQTGTRSGDPRLWRCNKKTFDIKGNVTIDLIDTNFDKNVRYGLISPSSKIRTVNSQSEFIIEQSYGSPFGINEFAKWVDFIGVNIVIRTVDYSLVSDPVQLVSTSGNTFTIANSASISITSGMIIEFAPYTNLGVDPVVQTVKLIYASVTDDENDFGDGGAPYKII